MMRSFSLEYLDWCKKYKHAKTIKETYRRDWVSEFYHSKEWDEEPVDGLEYAICLNMI